MLVDFERWITLAPIVERTATEYTLDTKALWQHIEKFDAPKITRKMKIKRFFARKKNIPAPVQVTESWSENKSSLSMMLRSYYHMEGCHYFTYFLSGIPVGVMRTAKPYKNYFVIEHFATHPAVSGAGGSMLEFIFHHAKTKGWPLKMQLKPLGSAAREAYKALGFRNIEEEYMELDPKNSSGKWSLLNGSWRLAKYSDQQYET